MRRLPNPTKTTFTELPSALLPSLQSGRSGWGCSFHNCHLPAIRGGLGICPPVQTMCGSGDRETTRCPNIPCPLVPTFGGEEVNPCSTTRF
jgi:hypothetical protein